jgi:hypothetical protein
VAEAHAGREVKPTDKILGLAIAAVFVGVLENGDAVGTLGSVRRRQRHFIVLGAQPLIDEDRFEAGGIGILQILNQPDATAVVERNGDRLADDRLGGDQGDFEAVGDLHALDCLFRGETLGMREFG